MNSSALLFLLAITFSYALGFDVKLNQHWSLWKQTHKKQYSVTEELVRRAIWESNLKIVNDHNLKADLGLHTYWLGMNAYADMSNAEFNRVMNGYKASARVQNTNAKVFTFDANIKLPDSIDWRTKGYVTPIKDEGQCSASWAFSTTGAIEGQHFAQTGQLVSLSEQNLIDCSQKQGTMGCNGGLMDLAFTYVLENKGIDTESSYPYTGIPGPCRFSPRDVGANITGYVDIVSKDENALQSAIATVGPISVAIDASHSSFQLYKRGVYNERNCSQTQIDRGLLAVGYGSEGSSDYWIVKNSWGTSWGDEGYIKMSRNKNNQCGIATMASYPSA